MGANSIRSINNIVDIANLVMLETGQPFHIFDYGALLGKKKIVIHKTEGGEIMTALHSQKLTLNSDDIVISSGGKIIDLAGIIGTQETALTPQTKNILIECASFNATSIKKTANRLNISTSASQYFSRRANLVLTPPSTLSRVTSLIIESYGGNLNSGEIFTYKEAIEKEEQQSIAISPEFITKKIGQFLPEQVISNI
ncbi:MAG: phenylalanine--tRNA ligase beta subunit-related protein [Mollicutes bacterium UO1]